MLRAKMAQNGSFCKYSSNGKAPHQSLAPVSACLCNAAAKSWGYQPLQRLQEHNSVPCIVAAFSL